MNEEKKKRLKKRLMELLMTEEQLSKLVENANQAVELDQTRLGRLSRMDAMQSQQISQETTRRQIQYNQLVKKALVRIESEEYGYCESCDEEINILRLEADPIHYLCIKCAD
jgi:DnaK suppressor protein